MKMVMDYKDASFSFEKIKSKKRLKRLRLIVFVTIVLFLVVLLINFLDLGKINEAQSLLLEGKTDEASARIKEMTPSLFHSITKKELTALLHLFSNEFEESKKILDKITGNSTVIDSWKFLDYFSERAEYRKLEIYSGYLDKKMEKQGKSQDLLFYKVLVKTGLMDYPQATAAIAHLSPGIKEKNAKALTLLNQVNTQIKSGKINYIHDIDGKPLAYYDIRKKSTISLVPGISFDAFTSHIQQSIKFYRLTLDRRIQEKIHRLFTPWHGSFLLVNVNDSSIAAAYSKPLEAGKDDINTVFSETYEPGSIIKLLTLFTYMKSSPTNIFPMDCKGFLPIKSGNGDIFYDWMVHHRVNDGEEALAVSCNIAFARMGIDLGFPSLSETLNRFYFNTPSPAFTDLFLGFNTGTYKTDIAPTEHYRLANLAVGLEEISITTLHSALLSVIISQNGSFYDPYLIKNKKNLLNMAFYNHTPRLIDVYKANTVYLRIKNAMKLAVESPNGTGKRAQVDFVTVALKTGTAGNKQLGLDAILTGFFPVEKPKYAFALRLQQAGKAEWQGALFLKDFLIAMGSATPAR